MSKKLSIVIPCYNHGEFVAEAVDSARRINRPDVEIILVDDGSTDENTKKEVDRLESQGGITVIRQRNGGPASARNGAIRNAQGEYLLPLDSDNKIEPAYVEHGIRIMDAQPKVGVVYGDAQYFGTRTGRWVVGPFDADRMLHWNFIDACAIFRRKVWQQNCGYDGAMPVRGLEDWDFWLGTMENGWEFAYVPEVVFHYRVAEESMITRTHGREEEVAAYIAKKHWKLYWQAWRVFDEKQQELLNRHKQLVKDRDSLKQNLKQLKKVISAKLTGKKRGALSPQEPVK
jgi:glycosyltransferase involved in cell wall biosynthesis